MRRADLISVNSLAPTIVRATVTAVRAFSPNCASCSSIRRNCDIPEADYGKLVTLNDLVAYLRDRIPSRTA